jgi:large subunit ribosomal protein L24
MRKIRKGDQVVVLAGKDRGMRGIVSSVHITKGLVVVQGLNKGKRHEKPDPVKGRIGGVVEFERPLHISNIALFNEAVQRASRVGVRYSSGRKTRYFKLTGDPVGVEGL